MLELHRLHQSDKGTFGKMFWSGELVAHTCEEPWKNNQRRISCIPKGDYPVVKRISPKYRHHWHIQDVPNRTWILIHIGNYLKDTEGCILVGDRYLRDKQGDIIGVGNSVATMGKLRNLLPDAYTIQIT